MSHPALSFDQITRTSISPDTLGQHYAAVQNISLEVHADKFASVVGSTGCGKSMLLNLVAGLLQPSSGQARVSGELLVGTNRRAGYMFQAEVLMPWRSALDSVMAGLEFQGILDKEARDLAMSRLVRVDLADSEDRYPHQFSGGMCRRVSLAQALVSDPDITLMDEPFSAFDIQTRQLIENEVLDLWAAKRKAVLFITHDLDEAIAMSGRVVVLAAGPGTHSIDELTTNLPHPRDAAKIHDQAGFVDLHSCIWDVLREEVFKDYTQHRRVA